MHRRLLRQYIFRKFPKNREAKLCLLRTPVSRFPESQKQKGAGTCGVLFFFQDIFFGRERTLTFIITNHTQ
jgi:hypothetical protein